MQGSFGKQFDGCQGLPSTSWVVMGKPKYCTWILGLKTLIKRLLMNTDETDQRMIMTIHCSTSSSHNIEGPLDSTIHMV
jgi:hypothetical protein